jgi:Zn finger protein HypA/HybF involved in hydrogenase expression
MKEMSRVKILKQGLSKAELEKKRKRTKQFECHECGCIFSADAGEYKFEEDYIYTTYFCDCPNCSEKAFEYIGR